MKEKNVRQVLKALPNYLKEHYWSDGMVRVAGREYSGLLVTPCHTHDDQSRQMSCISCHALHQPVEDPRSLAAWANDQLGVGMETNQACIQCHEDFVSDEQLQAHTHHAPGSVGSLCYNCHMPYTTFGLLKAIRSDAIDSPNVQTSLNTGRPNACNQCHLDKTLAWTAEQLWTRYDIRQPELTPDQQIVAASILWTLSGDAGQRALMAWSMNWSAAHEAMINSEKPVRTSWMLPYLSELMKDPYPAVRFLAEERLVSFTGLEDVEYDFLAPESERNEKSGQVWEIWETNFSEEGRSLHDDSRGPLLLDSEGALKMETLNRLLENRDHTVINLQE